MKGITQFSMKNVGLIFIIILLMLGGGVWSVQTMKMESLPNVDIPYLSVVTVYPGATPDQVLADIGKPMEAQLAGLKGLKNLYVTSRANVGYVTMEFEMSKDMDDAEQEVQAAIAKLTLPDSAQDPTIRKEGPSAEAIYSFVVDGAGAPQADVQEFVEETIQPQLAAIDGVSKVAVDGSGEKKVYVKVDPEKLKAHKLSLDQVKQALMANNISAPTGEVTIDGKTMNVQVGKQLTSLEEIRNVNLILVEQDMSGMTDAFEAIGDGMGQLGGAVGGLGTSVGVMAKSQELMQTEIELIAGINGLSGQLLADSQKLAGLQAAAQQNPQTAQDPQFQAQVKELEAKVQGTTKQIEELQGRLKQVQDGLKKLGVASDQALADLQKQQTQGEPKQPDAAKAGVALQIKSLKLSEIADVSYGTGGDEAYTRMNGQPAVVAGIVPTVGANVVEIVKQVEAKLDELKLPDGYTLTTLQDQSQDVKKSVNSMLKEAFFGALLAALVTMLFLRNLRATFVALLSIPLSILVTMIVMKWMDYSLNMMTLAGIAVAVGRVVDDSIVVIENLYRRILLSRAEERDDNFVLTATTEVAQPITSSTITTIAVFGPMAFVPGIVGKFFAPFAWSVVIALAFSLLIAVTVVPLMSKLFLLKLKPVEHKDTMLQRGYVKLLKWSLGHKTIVVLVSLALLGGTGLLVPQVPMNFFPQDKVSTYSFTADLPIGSSLEKANEVATRVEQVVHDTGMTKYYTASVRTGHVNIRLTLKDDADSAAFEKTMREGTQDLGEGIDTALRGIGGVPGSGGLMMVINGADLDTLKKASEDLKAAVETVPGLADVQTNVEGVRPQVTVKVDDVKAAEQGLNPVMIMASVRDMLAGSTAASVVIEGKTTELNLGLDVEGLDSLAKIADQKIRNMASEEVRIGDVATVEETVGATSIERLNQQEYVSINAKITDLNTSGVQAQVEEATAQVELPKGVSFYFEGESRAMAEGFRNMFIAIAVSVLLVYAVMLVAFGEMLAPLAILFSLPFIFIGAIGGLLLTGESLGMPALVGVLMLIGIVVTNAIVLMDRVLTNRRAGMSTYDSLIEAGSMRIRPILMTAVATIGALFPLAITTDAGLISRSLAIVVIGGLTTSTLLTLVIVPIAYTVLDNVREALFGRKGKAVRPTAKVQETGV